MSERVSVHRIRILLRDMPVELLRRELAAVFPQPSRAEAYAVIAGFEARQHRKLIVAVETATPVAGSRKRPQ